MRCIQSVEAGESRLVELPKPCARLGELVIKVGATGICGTDLHILAGEFPLAPFRLVPRHETARTIAEFVKVPAANAYLMLEGMSFTSGALAEPVSCAVHALDRLDHEPCEPVLIYGAGTMGLILAQLLRHKALIVLLMLLV